MYEVLFGALSAAFFLASLFDDEWGGIVLNVCCTVFAFCAIICFSLTDLYVLSYAFWFLAFVSLVLAIVRGVMMFRVRR